MRRHYSIRREKGKATLGASFPLKTTLGQHYRRVPLQRSGGDLERRDSLPSSNDGNGICFISHIGEVYPSGFLPAPCGNSRKASLVETYREHPVFLSLRDKGLRSPPRF
ncbi:MAG: hypothetical protein HY680_06390 [Chloroflexi bacterium]|nr:hypothetical protein [Chloroflexota bacterium]